MHRAATHPCLLQYNRDVTSLQTDAELKKEGRSADEGEDAGPLSGRPPGGTPELLPSYTHPLALLGETVLGRRGLR